MRCASSLAALLCAVAPGLARGDFGFVAIGDWGGQSDTEPTTESQRLTAVGLRRRALELGANFTLLMGDNFYQHGVQEAADVSPRFRDTFEEVYARLLPGMPFYAFAGNHDYGEGLMANVSSQVEYSRMSAQWRFPSLWYKIHREFEADGAVRTLDVLVIDTVILCGNGLKNEVFIDEQLKFLEPGAARGSKVLGGRRAAAAAKQWAWLEAELNASTADFLWVSGHYPIWSGGYDGNSQCLLDRLRPMLVQHGAQYISGHDHMLEHFEHGGLQTFVVGAGKECCYPPAKMWETPQGALRYMLAGKEGKDSQPPAPFPVRGGFASVRLGAESASVAFHAHNGATLYEALPIARRGAAAAQLAGGYSASPATRRAAVGVVGASLAWLVGLAAFRRSRGEWERQAAAPLIG